MAVTNLRHIIAPLLIIRHKCRKAARNCRNIWVRSTFTTLLKAKDLWYMTGKFLTFSVRSLSFFDLL